MTNFEKLGNRDAEWEGAKWKGDKPEPKAPRYTVTDSGRILMHGGIPMADAIDAPPALMRRIADLLNQHGEGPAGEEEAEAHNEAREC